MLPNVVISTQLSLTLMLVSDGLSAAAVDDGTRLSTNIDVLLADDVMSLIAG